MKKYCSYSDSACGQSCPLTNKALAQGNFGKNCILSQKQFSGHLFVPNRSIERIKDRQLRSENLCSWQRANICFCHCSKSVSRFAERYNDKGITYDNWKCRQLDRNYIRKCLVSGLNDMGIRCLDEQNMKGEMFYLSKHHQKPILTNSSVHPDAVHPCDMKEKQRQAVRPRNQYGCRDKRLQNVELELRYQAFKECIVGKFERSYWQKNRPVGAQHLYKTFMKCTFLSFENVYMTTAVAKTHRNIQNIATKQKLNPDRNLPPTENTEMKHGHMTNKTQKPQQWKTNNIGNSDLIQFNVLEPHEAHTQLKSPLAKNVAVSSKTVANTATRKDNKKVPTTSAIKAKASQNLKPPRANDFNESTNVNKMEPLDGISIVNPVKLAYSDSPIHEATYEVNEGEPKIEIVEFQENQDKKVSPTEILDGKKFQMVDENVMESEVPINQMTSQSDDVKVKSKRSKKKKTTSKEIQDENEIDEFLIVKPISTSSGSSDEPYREESQNLDNIYKIINSSDKGNKDNHKNHAVKTDTPLETQENIKDKLYKSKSGSLIPRHDENQTDMGNLKGSEQLNDISLRPVLSQSNEEVKDNNLESNKETNFIQSIDDNYQPQADHLTDSPEANKMKELSNLNEDKIEKIEDQQPERKYSFDETFDSPFIDPLKIEELSVKLTNVVASRLSIVEETIDKIVNRTSKVEQGFYEFKPGTEPEVMTAEMDNKVETKFVNLESTSSLMIDENSFFKKKDKIQDDKTNATSDRSDKQLGNKTSNDADSSDDDDLIKANNQGLNDIVKGKQKNGKHISETVKADTNIRKQLDTEDEINQIDGSHKKHDRDKQEKHHNVADGKHKPPNGLGRDVRDVTDKDFRKKDKKQHGEMKTVKHEHSNEMESGQIFHKGVATNVKTQLTHKVGKQLKDQSKDRPIKAPSPTNVRHTEQKERDFRKHNDMKGQEFQKGEKIDCTDKAMEIESEHYFQKHSPKNNGKKEMDLKYKSQKPNNQVMEDEIFYDTKDKNMEFSGGAIKSLLKITRVDSECRTNVRSKCVLPIRQPSEKLCLKYSQISNVRHFAEPHVCDTNKEKCNFVKASFQNKHRSMISKPASRTSFQLPKRCLFKFTLMPNQCPRKSEFKLPIKSYCKLINNTARCNGKNPCGPLIEMDNCRKSLNPSCNVGKGYRFNSICKNKNIFNVQNMYGMTCLIKPQEYCYKNLKSNLSHK